MKLLAPLLLLPLAFPLAAALQEKEKEHDEPETELAERMEELEDHTKALRKSLKPEGSSADALTHLAEIQRLTLVCKTMTPAAAGKLPEKERAAFVTAFRRSMVDFMQRQLELEAALLDGDAPAAQAAFDRFREMEDSSHERFAPADD
jgi:hypothetical protein